MFKFGAYALIWTSNFTDKELSLFDKLKAMEFDGIEIPLGKPFLKTLPKSGIKKKMEETGIKCVFSTGLDEKRNIISPDQSKRNQGVEYLKKCVEVAAEFGSDVLGGVLYAPWGGFTGLGRTLSEWEFCKESLLKVAEFAKSRKIVLAIEPVNRFESYFLNTASDTKRLVGEIDSSNVRMQLDTFQMNIEENSMYEAIKVAGSLLYHFHCCASHRGIPGTGHVEWDEVFKALREVNYSRWLVIESFTPKIIKGFGRQTAVWRKLAPSADAIAEQGLKFLKTVSLKH